MMVSSWNIALKVLNGKTDNKLSSRVVLDHWESRIWEIDIDEIFDRRSTHLAVFTNLGG